MISFDCVIVQNIWLITLIKKNKLFQFYLWLGEKTKTAEDNQNFEICGTC